MGFGQSYQQPSINNYPPVPDFDRNEPYGMSFNKDSFQDGHKPYYNKGMSHVFLDECSYTVDKKKMDAISDKVDKYFKEIPEAIREAISFGKVLNLFSLDKETEKLRDSTSGSSRSRRDHSHYNFDLLNDMSAKIKS